MDAFLYQIKEDIAHIQKDWDKYDENVKKDYYAFNYWILMYLYNLDIDLAQDNIVEYKDKGMDCWVHFKDTKELYLIQNKYFIETESLDAKEVTYFLNSPLSSLAANTYSRSPELQKIYNEYVKDDEDYTVYLYLYITKPKSSINVDIFNIFKQTNNTHFSNLKHSIEAKLIDIDEINIQYNSERKRKETSFDWLMPVFGTRKNYISQDPEQLDRDSNVKTTYTAVGIWGIYEMYQKAEEKEYDIFDKNIREYLGVKIKTNKQMYNTLIDKKDEGERNRFFYYNNGITIICSEIGKSTDSKEGWKINIKNPQVVNGCQTVNTIVRAVEDVKTKIGEKETKERFKNSSVLVKIYQVIDDNNGADSVYERIVRNTNTQNGVKMKDFSSKNKYFLELQSDFLNRGFYLLVKSSDSNKFKEDMQLFENIKQKSKTLCEVFGKTIEKPEDLFIDISLLLKALAAFVFDGYVAFSEGASTLKENSTTYYIDFSKRIRDYFTTDNMICLYLLYSKSGGNKRAREDRFPIPYYMMDFIGRFIKNRNDSKEWDFTFINEKLEYLFSEKEIFDEIYELYKYINEDYGAEFCEKNGVDYATMTKARKIDNELITELFERKKKEAQRRGDEYFLSFIS